MVKDYARRRNHYDLAHQQVLLIQEGGLNNNSSFKSNFKSDNNIKANIKSNNVNIKWLWVICVAMLVLFFLLIPLKTTVLPSNFLFFPQINAGK